MPFSFFKSSSTRQDGQKYEEMAAKYLKKHGLKLAHKNFHARGGEIDIIMTDGDILVFVEVRYRQTERHGKAVETVGSAKQKRLIHTATTYLCKHYGNTWPSCRFDVIGLSRDFMGNLTYDWVKNAFELS